MAYAEIQHTAEKGHNIVISGQAGTGKSFMLKKLYKYLLSINKKVQITATTGIASTLLPDAKTVHSFFGLLDGRYATQELLHKVKYDDNYHMIKDNIIKIDVLMIDEVSMLSEKIFNQIEQLCRAVRGGNVVFGGLQVILCGDFLQLRPVANMKYDDAGAYVLQSDKFMFHKFILREVHRQTEGTLIQAVHEISRGLDVSQSTVDFLNRMKRKLPPGDEPIKIFARNFDVNKCNSDQLIDMDGEVKTYKSVDVGDIQELRSCPVDNMIHLKESAKVMLVVNLDKRLVNGLCGTVLKLKSDSVDIKFDSIKDSVTIHPYNFSVYNPEKKQNVASRNQLPLKLAFAITTHKSQGLTLKRIEIDCRHMTNPGQIGVAVGRASEVKGLRILNFNRNLVRKHPDFIYEFYSSDSIPVIDDMSCCKIHVASENVPATHPSSLDEIQDEESGHHDQILTSHEHHDEESDGESDSIIELEEFEILEQILNDWGDENNEEQVELEQPMPIDFDLQAVLSNMKYTEALTDEQINLNKCISDMYMSLHTVQRFCDNIHDKFYTFYKDSMPAENQNVENRHLTEFYRKITLFQSDEVYYDLVKALFCTTEPSETQYRVAYGICKNIRSLLIRKAAEPFKVRAREEASRKTKPAKDSKGSKAKIRYIGGWCMATIRCNKRKLVSRNLFKKTVRTQVNNWDKEVKFYDQLEEVGEGEFEHSSDRRETMVEIDRKQNSQEGLTVINEETLNFFIELDGAIQKLETFENVDIHTKNFYHFIISEIKNSEVLLEQWRHLFHNNDNLNIQESSEILDNMFNEIVVKYINMSSNAFRIEYKRDLKIQKEEAHRKQIRMRETKKVTQHKIDFQSILNDNSDSKLKSHLRLRSEIVGATAFLEVFTKDQLIRIGMAYQCVINKKMTKKDIIEIINRQILRSDTMPCPQKLASTPVIPERPTEEVPGTSKTTVKRKMKSGGKGKGKGKGKKQKLQEEEKEEEVAPCGICSRHCGEDCVCCDICDVWYHFVCLGVTGEEDEFNKDWYCQVCTGYT